MNTHELREIILALNGEEFDFPDEKNEMRRTITVRAASEAADELLMEGSDGSEEETDWLTSALAALFAEKAHHASQRRLLRKTFLEKQ